MKTRFLASGSPPSLETPCAPRALALPVLPVKAFLVYLAFFYFAPKPQAMPELVSFAQFAALKGCTKPAVSHAVKNRIAAAVVEKDGRRWLDRELAMELWTKNTLRNNRARMGMAGDPVAGQELPPRNRQAVRQRVAHLPDDAIPELNESRARREHYQAELAKLEVDHRRNELVAAEAVKKEAFSVAKTVREALINIPDRVANLLAAEGDATAIHMTLTEEITQALERLAHA